MNHFTLENKVILITGARGLIGTEIAKAYRDYGAKLALLDIIPLESGDDFSEKREEAELVEASYVCDITDEVRVSETIGKIKVAFGRIDCLVNLAAIDAKFDKDIGTSLKSAFESFPLDSWKKSVDVNITGLFNITQAVVNEMLNQGGGNIINVASTYSLVSPNQGLYRDENGAQNNFKPIDYVATKSMVPNFSRYLATTYARKGIRVNTIVPHGVVEGADETFMKNFSELSPMGRACKKDELIGPFVFLASDASSYMTGSNLVVDGGWTAW